MLVKLLGAALTVGACGVYGLSGARRIENRARHLRAVRYAVAILEKEITYVQNPLIRALEKTITLAGVPAQYLFADTLEYLNRKEGYTAEESWQKGVARLGRESALSMDDLALLGSLGPRLGMSGVEEQRKAFQLLVEELKVQENKALEAAASEKKLWSYGGFLLGTLIVLLLL